MKVQDVKYERLIEILNSTNPNVAIIRVHITMGYANGDSNLQCYNIECSTGYKAYRCKDLPTWFDPYWDIDEALNHLPRSCFIN